MKTDKKSLQKLSDLEAVNKVIALKKITRKDYDHFTPEQSKLLNSELQRMMSAAKTLGEKNALFDKIEAILDSESRNHRWQANHTAIQASIANLLQKLNRMPAVAEIAEETHLSRQTINKHLKNFDSQELYQQEWNKLRYASVNILGTVMKLAIKGDVKAARLYFDIINNQAGNTYIKNQQNNYLTSTLR